MAFEGGVVQIHNLYSGEILFNKLLEDSLRLQHEASNIMFVGEASPFWFMVTCWEGYVNFFSKPQHVMGKEFLQEKAINSNHKKDVCCIGINK